MPLPLDTAKYGRPSIVSPEKLAQHGLESGAYAEVPPPRAAILCYHRGLAQQLLASRAHVKIPGFFGDTYLLDETDREVALVADFGIGAPVAAVMLEDLIALGCRRVASIGTCGGMDQDLAVGDLLLCTGAVRDEGTSYHYLPDGEPARPDATLTDALAAELERRGEPYRRGDAWTTDAPYRETADEVRAHVAAGVPVVEMEAAALFAVGQVRAAQVASLLVVSDVLSTLDGSWVPEFHGDVVGSRLELAFETALAALR
ncbi:MAG: nucleoside phosphorylase [Thermoleophilia bacterium]|nr:nucleoside phosphorylase [Thermoleophilia bacterium]